MKNIRHATAKLALVGALAITAGLGADANAQLRAVAEILSPTDLQDPHPIEYFWEGEIQEPSRESVQYYHFYYAGRVEADATVKVGNDIKRVPIPLSEWELHRGAIIARLTSYYQEAYGVDTAQAATTPGVTGPGTAPRPGGAPAGPANTAGIDPVAAAEWTFYYDQVVLWQFHTRRVILNDTNAVRANASREELQRAADREALSSIEGINVDEVLAVAEAVRKSREAQTEPAGPGGGAGPGGRPSGTRPGGQAGPEGQPEIVAVAATLFDPDQDYADPDHNEVLREEFILLAEQREREATEAYREMLRRIAKRRSDQQQYEDWLADRRIQLRDFAEAWSRVRDGKSVFIDDTFYLIGKDPPEAVPHNSLAVPVREQVTPWDLLNSGGELKKPILP